jgi:hypothetical protein
MKQSMRKFWKRAVAVVLGLATPSTALAQGQLPAPIPPALPGTPLPPPTVTISATPGGGQPTAATAPPATAYPLVSVPQPGVASGVPAGVPQHTGPAGATPVLPGVNSPQPTGTNPSAVPTSFPAVVPTGPLGGLPDSLRRPVRTQPPPVMSSQPPPFQITPDAPTATNDANFFEGLRSVQDLTALFPGRFKDTKYKWYGFIRLDGIYDFRPMGSTDSFVTSAIPAPQGRGQNYVLTPRYTRLGFDTETPIKSVDWTLKTRIEMDFFNGNTSGLFGSFPIRLRFAWADFGPFLVGQAASLFMDYDVFPNVLDYQGPGGMVLMRQPLVAVRAKLGERTTVMAGVEQPYSDIQWFENGVWVTNPGSGIITRRASGATSRTSPTSPRTSAT